MLAFALIVASIGATSAAGYAPDSLDGKTLSYHIDKATGYYSVDVGQNILTSFKDGRFVDTELWGVALDGGTYSYHRTGPNQGEVLHHPTHGQYQGGDYLEKLHFDTATAGRAEGASVKGPGTYSGSFSIMAGYAPDSIEGKTLTYRIDKATGIFSADAGRALIITFSGKHYTATDAIGIVQDKGTYSFRRINPDHAEIIYVPTDSPWHGGQYSERLEFKSIYQGSAEGSSAGGVDTYHGSFVVT